MLKLYNALNSIEEVCDISHLQDVNTDLITSLCGEKIGAGSFRTVYEYNLDKKYVIKIEPSSDSNVAEAILWEEVQGLTNKLAWVKEWFAPVLWVSPNYKILVMQRTEEKPKKKRPSEVPSFFSDVHYRNFGWIGNRFVCHDYGFLYKFIKYEKKFSKVPKDTW